MSEHPPVALPVPWTDRGEPSAPKPSPRSHRDVEILRALADRINPLDAGAHNNLGVVYHNKGLLDDAIRQFEVALEIDPRMQVAERNLQIVYFGTGYYERTVEALSERLTANPADVEARDALAKTHFNGGALTEAVREWRILLGSRPDDPMLHQWLARAELKRGNPDGALAALHDAARLDDDNARTHLMIGEVLFQKGRNTEARDALERAVARDPRLSDAYHLLAFVYGDLGNDEKALRASALASELNPSYRKAEANLSLDSYSTARYEELVGSRVGGGGDPEVAEGGELAHYNLGLAFRQKALYDEALREFQLATQRGENPFLVRQAQAELLLLRADPEALELYHGLVEQEPGSPKIWNELGVAHHQAGELTEAEAAYLRSLDIDAAYALAWNNLAVVRHHLGNGSAEDAFRAAIEQGRALADVWRNYALLLHREGRLRESQLAYESSLEEDGADAQTRTGYGVLLMDLNRPQDARMQLLRAVEADPGMAEARYQLAFALSALGEYQSALRETKLALELSAYIPSSRFRLLMDLHFEEASVPAPELDTAEHLAGGDGVDRFQFHPDALEDVFGSRAHDVGAHAAATSPLDDVLRAAHAALEQRDYDTAMAETQRAASLGASRTELLLLQGEIFLRRGFSGEAVERFNEALAEIAGGADDSDDALRRALAGAARSLMDLGRMPQAVEAAERLCELAGDDVDALRILGEALSRVEDFARAAIVLEHARLGAPDDVGLLTQLGAAYAAAGDPEGAESALQRAISHDPRAVGARVALADVLVEEQRPEEAEFQYREALRLLPSYRAAAFGLIDLLEQRDRADDAIAVLVDVLTADPYLIEALVVLARLLQRTGRMKQARFAFERVLRFDPHHEAAHAGLADLGEAGA